MTTTLTNTLINAGFETGMRIAGDVLVDPDTLKCRDSFVEFVLNEAYRERGTLAKEFAAGVRKGAARGWVRRRGHREFDIDSLPSDVPVFRTASEAPASLVGEFATIEPPALWLRWRNGTRMISS